MTTISFTIDDAVATDALDYLKSILYTGNLTPEQQTIRDQYSLEQWITERLKVYAREKRSKAAIENTTISYDTTGLD